MQPSLPRVHALGWWLLVAAVTSYVVLSAQTLAWLGIPYDLPWGSPMAKLHPGTWLLVLSLGCLLVAEGHPIAAAIRRARQMPLVVLSLGCMVLVAVWSVAHSGTSGAAFIVDALWMPAVALLALRSVGAARERMLLHWLLALLVLNALLALGEFALGRTLVPRHAPDGLPVDEDWFRATALMGHPLANALQTLALMPAAMVLRPRWRWPAVALLLASLLAFGGRTALAAALLIYGGALAVGVGRGVVQGRYSYLQLTGGLLAVLAGTVGGAIVAWASGLGERIFANLAWDNSANVRLVAWQALAYLDDRAWVVGLSPAEIGEIVLRLGLDPRYETIENFWVALVLQLGLVGFLPFLLGLGALLVHLWRQAMPAMRVALVAYLLVASGANTLASKTVSLTLLAVAIACSASWRTPALQAGPRFSWAFIPRRAAP